jgi:RimJ/RimL family protein N-acetyltransferase
MTDAPASFELNEFGQPVGLVVSSWLAPPLPGDAMLTGSACRIEPLSAANHTASLYTANETASDGRAWTYLPYGPFESFEDYHAWVSSASSGSDPSFYAIIDLKTGRAAGVASLMRMDPKAGSIEVGHIHLSPLLQRTRTATEAMYLLMRYAFGLGYRRYEWKCDALNTVSCAAGQRLGFRPEGVHRQARVAKGRNRDTAWFSILDSEWPARRAEFERWLASSNFDAKGEQRTSLRMNA